MILCSTRAVLLSHTCVSVLLNMKSPCMLAGCISVGKSLSTCEQVRIGLDSMTSCHCGFHQDGQPHRFT